MNERSRARRRVYALLFAAALAAAVATFGARYGSRAAAGADPFGYVSQAYLWLNGHLQLEQPLSSEFPWPHPEETLSPLGYRPGEIRNTVVPSYPPGVPLVMAAFDKVFSDCGPYLVTPTFAALLILATFTLAERVTGTGAAATAATVLMAGSPAFLFNLMFPMSDIVAASLWTTALALLARDGLFAAAVAGCASGLAILARPNLVPLAVVLAIAAVTWPHGGEPRRGFVRTAVFSIGAIAGAFVVAYINRWLYGSPFASGYGDASILYSVSFSGTNLVRYADWLLKSESWVVVVAVLPFVMRRAGTELLARPARLLLALFASLVCLSYLFYLPFDDWWFLRFLLPAFPVLFVFEAAALDWAVKKLRLPFPRIALFIIVAMVVAYRVWFAAGHGLMRIGADEQRYVAVGQYIERALPANAVVLSMQHSGSVRYYSGRLTFRYDLLSPTRLPFVLDWFRAHGFRPYILLDDSEEAGYRRQFGSGSAVARLEIRVLAEMTAPVGVRLYDPEPYVGDYPPPDPIVLRSSRVCVPPAGVWAR